MPDIVIEVTTERKPEHTHWLCKKTTNQETRQRCDTKHPISTVMCTGCGNHRVVHSEAQDDEGKTLGVLVSNDKGVEKWHYL